eukprot:scaffold87241_cov40-Tisochrysis_lutea.AAC.4
MSGALAVRSTTTNVRESQGAPTARGRFSAEERNNRLTVQGRDDEREKERREVRETKDQKRKMRSTTTTEVDYERTVLLVAGRKHNERRRVGERRGGGQGERALDERIDVAVERE